MANLSSSKKMVRKIIKRTERNKSLKTNVRTYIRRFEEAIDAGKINEAQDALKIVQPKLMKLAQKGILHKKNASRKISRLQKKLKSLN
ncbi:MAG: 30S ribosomal protein S20 [Pseudomonadota bacterium]|nr:30S ribosomal protein S20 [Pseudomonadota bacterium]MEC9382390.1 30S ribosomal protein S20 [Pseudomonadota bacterium]MEC9481494.1 30S ribosomal protein S20 [Pseudomonadota bacterium]|tara:strand:+ start:60 stop:323 length:264 start_codon:yes stop_codon:yes gene_type:complete